MAPTPIHGIDIFDLITPQTKGERDIAIAKHGNFHAALLRTFKQTNRAKLTWLPASALSRSPAGDASLANLAMTNPKWQKVLAQDVRHILRYVFIFERGDEEAAEGFVREVKGLAKEWYGDDAVVRWKRDEVKGVDPEYSFADREGFGEQYAVHDIEVEILEDEDEDEQMMDA